VLTDEVPGQAALLSESRRLDIQGLRAVAVILVVAFHAGLPVHGGFMGVDVFLVISGFVIMGMLMRELERTGTVRFRSFYSRRIKRLLPALALLTTTVVALSVLLGSSSFGTQQTTAKTGLGATFFTANVVIYRETGYFSPDAALNPLLHTWTLSVEEQVYLVFPSLLLASWVIGRRLLRASRRGAAVMLGLVAVSSFLLCLLLSFGWVSIPWIGNGERFAFYSAATRIWEFAIGAALALAASHLKLVSRNVSTAAGVAGAVAIAVGAFTTRGGTPYPGVVVLLPVLGAAGIITSGFGSHGVSRLLATRPMAKIGDLSYSWYLWHWPLIVFGAILWPSSSWVLVPLAALSLVPAWLSTVFLEDPIRRNSAIKGRRVVALALACTFVPTLACLGLAAGAKSSWGNQAMAEMQAQVRAPHVAETNHCDDAESSGVAAGGSACEFNTTESGPHVYLVGNSVAAQYSEALVGASDTVGSPLTIDTTHGCPFSGQGEDRECSDSFAAIMDRLTQRPPGVVVMSSTWDLAVNLSRAGEPATPEQKLQVLISSLTETISRLRNAGHEVVVVLPTPRFFNGSAPGTFVAVPETFDTRFGAPGSVWGPYCSATGSGGDPQACGATVPEAEEDAAQSLTVEALRKVARDTGSTTLDLREQFCPAGVCRTNIGNFWMFRDGVHLTVGESEALAPTFAGLLRQMVKRG
jgi:peptidoglycan/LPS O-acetylase OafA/YrhL